MTTDEIKPQFEPELIDRELRSKRLPLGFARPLERQMEAETGLQRSRQLVIYGSAGLVLFICYLLVDYHLTSDTFVLAVALRLGVVAPLALMVMVFHWFNPPATLREIAAGAIIFIGVLPTFVVMLLSASPLRDTQADATLLLILFVTVVQRIRFPYAVATCLAIYAAYSVAVTSMPEYPPARYQADIMVCGLAVILSLIGAWHGEAETRRAYLLNLAVRMRNDMLDGIARRDPLTGLANRRALDLKLAEIRSSASDGEDIAVILADLDHFKVYNDTFGHPAGDACLKRIAGVIQDGMRKGTDFAFRYGGEEFLILLRATALTDALGVAERLRRSVEDAAIPHPTRGVCTASFGVAASLIGTMVSVEELIKNADSALYSAKSNGRNQVWPPFLPKGGNVVGLERRKHAG